MRWNWRFGHSYENSCAHDSKCFSIPANQTPDESFVTFFRSFELSVPFAPVPNPFIIQCHFNSTFSSLSLSRTHKHIRSSLNSLHSPSQSQLNGCKSCERVFLSCAHSVSWCFSQSLCPPSPTICFSPSSNASKVTMNIFVCTRVQILCSQLWFDCITERNKNRISWFVSVLVLRLCRITTKQTNYHIEL